MRVSCAAISSFDRRDVDGREIAKRKLVEKPFGRGRIMSGLARPMLHGLVSASAG
jgi:hypothetical protein